MYQYIYDNLENSEKCVFTNVMLNFFSDFMNIDEYNLKVASFLVDYCNYVFIITSKFYFYLKCYIEFCDQVPSVVHQCPSLKSLCHI